MMAMSAGCREALRCGLMVRGKAVATACLLLAASPAAAQELSFSFTNPSFGGNPFNSAHLLAIAEAQRPNPPSASSSVSQTQLFAQQLQSRLLSALSAGITTAITGSKAGDTGEFVIGDQRITFENTGTEIKVTIFNQVTGETTTISVPVFNFSTSGASTSGKTSAATTPASPETALRQLFSTAERAGPAPAPAQSAGPGSRSTALASLPPL